MRNKRQVIERLRTLENEIQPEGSLQARISALNPRDRAIYDRWKKTNQEYWSQYEGKEMYEAFLIGITNESSEPKLPLFIAKQLYPRLQNDLSPYEAYQKILS